MSNLTLLTAGIDLKPDSLNLSNSLDTTLTLINYDNVDVEQTLDSSNSTNPLLDYNNLKVIDNSEQYHFEGLKYSIKPSVASVIRKDGKAWYDHMVDFVIYSDTPEAKNVIKELSGGRFVAIIKDDHYTPITGLRKRFVFGLENGLTISKLGRKHTDPENGNFYQVSLKTSKMSAKESGVEVSFGLIQQV